MTHTRAMLRGYFKKTEQTHGARTGRPEGGVIVSDSGLGELLRILALATGWPAAKTYSRLTECGLLPWSEEGTQRYFVLRTLQNWFKEQKFERNIPYSRPSRWLTQRFQFYLYQDLVIDHDNGTLYLLLLAYEYATGFMHAQWYELRLRRSLAGTPLPAMLQVSKSGRPRNMAGQHGSSFATLASNGSIHLPDEELKKFLYDCQQRFCLPIGQIRLPAQYGDAHAGELGELIGKVANYPMSPLLAIAAGSGPATVLNAGTCTLTAANVSRLRHELTRFIDRHNQQQALPVLRESWSTIEANLRPRSSSGVFFRHSKMSQIIDEAELNAFFFRHLGFTGDIPSESMDIKVLSLEKKPAETGETGTTQPLGSAPADDTASATS